MAMTEPEDMTESEDRLALEREEIEARITSFRATQAKFQREREEFFATTLQNARRGSAAVPARAMNLN
jgi:hypothetical protein